MLAWVIGLSLLPVLCAMRYGLVRTGDGTLTPTRGRVGPSIDIPQRDHDRNRAGDNLRKVVLRPLGKRSLALRPRRRRPRRELIRDRLSRNPQHRAGAGLQGRRPETQGADHGRRRGAAHGPVRMARAWAPRRSELQRRRPPSCAAHRARASTRA